MNDVNKWSDKETDYLKKNYKNRTLKQISKELNRTERSVYGKFWRLNLKTRKHWSQEEEEYLEDSLGRLSVSSIARQLCRTKNAIYAKISELGFCVIDPFEVTIKKTAKKIKLDPMSLYRAANNGELKTDGRAKGKNRYHLVDDVSIREFIFKYYPYKKLNCYICGTVITGDMYCMKCLPKGDPPKPSAPKRETLYFSDNGNLVKIGNIIRKIRMERGLKQKDFAEIVGYHENWVCKIERGKVQRLDIDTLLVILRALNCNTEMIVSKL